MDQIKIGKFIALRRKKVNLTQESLAEKLYVTDRAVSKWENGRSMPDSSIMLELCNILDITVNELLSGEEINMKEYNKKAEDNLLKIEAEKQEKDKQLLKLEYVIGYTSSISFLTLIFIASYIEMDFWLKMVLIIIGSVIFAFGAANALKIEQVAGYYECNKCHHKYVPEYNSVFWAMHLGRTRYLKCPKCNEKSWNKKVLK